MRQILNPTSYSIFRTYLCWYFRIFLRLLLKCQAARYCLPLWDRTSGNSSKKQIYPVVLILGKYPIFFGYSLVLLVCFCGLFNLLTEFLVSLCFFFFILLLCQSLVYFCSYFHLIHQSTSFENMFVLGGQLPSHPSAAALLSKTEANFWSS